MTHNIHSIETLVPWTKIPIAAEPSVFVFDVIATAEAVAQAGKSEKDAKAFVEQMEKDGGFGGDGSYEKKYW